MSSEVQTAQPSSAEAAVVPPSTKKEKLLPAVVLSKVQFIAVVVALWGTMLLVALDQTILATALPRIASGFNNFTLQGWASSSYVLAQSTFLFPYGQLLRIYPSKWGLISGVVIFETGSLVSALSQNISTLIAGRIITGVGAAGLFIPILQISAEITTLRTRPKLFAIVGTSFGLASILGPIIGGVLTDNVTWRWCFYINLPVGGATAAALFFTLKATAPLGVDQNVYATWKRRDFLDKTMGMDFIGMILSIGAIVSLNIALQWGGNLRPWDDAGVIICLVLFVVLAVAVVFWEHYIGPDRAMVPLVIFKSYSIYALSVFSFTIRFGLLVFCYYLPIYFQAARHHSATRSATDLLPFLLSVVIANIIAGGLVAKLKRYWHMMAIGPIFGMIGAGLLYTIGPDTTSSTLIGYQILVGIWPGITLSNSLFALQAEFQQTPHLIGQASSLGSFWQILGGTIGLGISEPIFASQLDRNLKIYAPNAPHDFVKNSPTNIWTGLPVDMIPGVVRSYTESLRIVYITGVGIAGVALISCFFIKNIKIDDPHLDEDLSSTKEPEASEEKKAEV